MLSLNVSGAYNGLTFRKSLVHYFMVYFSSNLFETIRIKSSKLPSKKVKLFSIPTNLNILALLSNDVGAHSITYAIGTVKVEVVVVVVVVVFPVY